MSGGGGSTLAVSAMSSLEVLLLAKTFVWRLVTGVVLLIGLCLVVGALREARTSAIKYFGGSSKRRKDYSNDPNASNSGGADGGKKPVAKYKLKDKINQVLRRNDPTSSNGGTGLGSGSQSSSGKRAALKDLFLTVAKAEKERIETANGGKNNKSNNTNNVYNNNNNNNNNNNSHNSYNNNAENSNNKYKNLPSSSAITLNSSSSAPSLEQNGSSIVQNPNMHQKQNSNDSFLEPKPLVNNNNGNGITNSPRKYVRTSGQMASSMGHSRRQSSVGYFIEKRRTKHKKKVAASRRGKRQQSLMQEDKWSNWKRQVRDGSSSEDEDSDSLNGDRGVKTNNKNGTITNQNAMGNCDTIDSNNHRADANTTGYQRRNEKDEQSRFLNKSHVRNEERGNQSKSNFMAPVLYFLCFIFLIFMGQCIFLAHICTPKVRAYIRIDGENRTIQSKGQNESIASALEGCFEHVKELPFIATMPHQVSFCKTTFSLSALKQGAKTARVFECILNHVSGFDFDFDFDFNFHFGGTSDHGNGDGASSNELVYERSEYYLKRAIEMFSSFSAIVDALVGFVVGSISYMVEILESFSEYSSIVAPLVIQSIFGEKQELEGEEGEAIEAKEGEGKIQKNIQDQFFSAKSNSSIIMISLSVVATFLIFMSWNSNTTEKNEKHMKRKENHVATSSEGAGVTTNEHTALATTTRSGGCTNDQEVQQETDGTLSPPSGSSPNELNDSFGTFSNIKGFEPESPGSKRWENLSEGVSMDLLMASSYANNLDASLSENQDDMEKPPIHPFTPSSYQTILQRRHPHLHPLQMSISATTGSQRILPSQNHDLASTRSNSSAPPSLDHKLGRINSGTTQSTEFSLEMNFRSNDPQRFSTKRQEAEQLRFEQLHQKTNEFLSKMAQKLHVSLQDEQMSHTRAAIEEMRASLENRRRNFLNEMN